MNDRIHKWFYIGICYSLLSVLFFVLEIIL
nr:MAG TPA: protein of unknown function (DUF5383) [Caudoviricetes sp.]